MATQARDMGLRWAPHRAPEDFCSLFLSALWVLWLCSRLLPTRSNIDPVPRLGEGGSDPRENRDPQTQVCVSGGFSLLVLSVPISS